MTAVTTESSGIAASAVARRVGDLQLAAHAETLADAFARGELTRAELDARTEFCLAAVTDADLARLIADLPDRTPAVEASPSRPDPRQRAVHLLTRVVAFELVLVVIAYVLGVDLESELRSWYFIAFEIWAVGTAAGAGGALLLRSSSHQAARKQFS